MRHLFRHVAVSALLILPAVAGAEAFGSPAETRTCNPEVQLCNPIRFGSIPELITGILQVAIDIGVPLAALGIIYSGFLLVQAQDNPGERAKALEALKYTLIGAAIILGAFVIVRLLEATIKSVLVS